MTSQGADWPAVVTKRLRYVVRTREARLQLLIKSLYSCRQSGVVRRFVHSDSGGGVLIGCPSQLSEQVKGCPNGFSPGLGPRILSLVIASVGFQRFKKVKQKRQALLHTNYNCRESHGLASETKIKLSVMELVQGGSHLDFCICC